MNSQLCGAQENTPTALTEWTFSSLFKNSVPSKNPLPGVPCKLSLLQDDLGI